MSCQCNNKIKENEKHSDVLVVKLERNEKKSQSTKEESYGGASRIEEFVEFEN